MALDPFEHRLNQLENDIQKLKVLYDQYFRGVAKEIPQTLHDSVAREVRTFSTGLKTLTTNTSFRFRAQQLVARYNSYLHIWQKSLRDIEEGKVQRKRVGGENTEHALETSQFVFSRPEGEQGEMERMLKRVRLEYKRLGNTDGPSAERIRRMVEEQTKAVRSRFGVDEVAYEVAHDGQKVRIKVKPVGKATRSPAGTPGGGGG